LWSKPKQELKKSNAFGAPVGIGGTLPMTIYQASPRPKKGLIRSMPGPGQQLLWEIAR
jgi:hypothetical protein